MRLTLILGLAAAFTLTASAADVGGKWKATYETPDGQARESTFDFKVDGAKLTGTVSSPRGESTISDGKISGDEISFSVVRNIQGSDVKLMYKGKVSGAEIKFNVSFGDREFEIVAKRIST